MVLPFGQSPTQTEKDHQQVLVAVIHHYGPPHIATNQTPKNERPKQIGAQFCLYIQPNLL